jgi:hypothetical protein
MVKISTSEGKLAATASGDIALYSTDRVEFSGRVFSDHTYYIVAADSSMNLLSAWIAATRSGEGLFVYANLPCTDPAMESYLSGKASRAMEIWLYDDNTDVYVCHASVNLIASPLPAGLVRYSAVIALPSSPSAGEMYYLTTADDTAKAPPGVYVYGTGWSCLSYNAVYALGNLGATPSLTLIPGVKYTAVKNATITSLTIALTATGTVSVRHSGAQTVSAVTATGRTLKGRGASYWTDAGVALGEWQFTDDGTYLVPLAVELV